MVLGWNFAPAIARRPDTRNINRKNININIYIVDTIGKMNYSYIRVMNHLASWGWLWASWSSTLELVLAVCWRLVLLNRCVCIVHVIVDRAVWIVLVRILRRWSLDRWQVDIGLRCGICVQRDFGWCEHFCKRFFFMMQNRNWDVNWYECIAFWDWNDGNFACGINYKRLDFISYTQALTVLQLL